MKRLLTVIACSIVLSLVVSANGVLAAQPELPNASAANNAFAEGLKVEDSQGAYVTKIVTAENVKGVKVRLSKEIVRNDCNERTMRLTNVLVSIVIPKGYKIEVVVVK